MSKSPLGFTFAFLILFFGSSSCYALSTSTSTSTSITTTITTNYTLSPTPQLDNSSEPTCWPASYFPSAPDTQDCILSTQKYRRDPFFDTPAIYSRHPRNRHIRRVPKYWRTNTCVLLLTALPDAAAEDRFTLASTVPALEALLRECVYDKKYPLGGHVGVGNGKGFVLTLGGEPSVEA